MKNVTCDGIPVFCAFDELVEITELIPHPKNPNTHPQRQLEMLSRNISELGWRAPVTVSKRSGYIVRGHGRMMAAKYLGSDHVRVDSQEYEAEAAELADLIADNRLSELGVIDDDALKDALDALKEMDIDFELSGYELFDGDTAGMVEDEDETYTKKINIPQYEITGECPELSELVKAEKSTELKAKIEAASVTDEEKAFLMVAADRHNAFDYRKIAEYYAHATPEMQRLMEDSALVIIDLENAIANGYVRLSDDIQSMIEDDVDDEE